MHIPPLAGLRFRLPCENKNWSAIADAIARRTVACLAEQIQKNNLFAYNNIYKQ
ncbi:MAG: hypothetical protein LBU34_01835 [Planctomycetaceae bacterium]|nr:hypothetical protein [Planctomycetaceae bacterium]